MAGSGALRHTCVLGLWTMVAVGAQAGGLTYGSGSVHVGAWSDSGVFV